MISRLSALVLVGTLASASPAWAVPGTAQPIDKTWETCNRAVQAAERAGGIPKHLLSAISRAESGRWNKQKRANLAWPWTVTANGRGKFFDSKVEAMAEAEILLTEGVRNIDVGCMQINLMYHADAFETLSQAFDPAANARYGAKYLRIMHERTGDWRQAAAHYHSTTPEKANKYRRKVMRLWNESRNIPAPVVAEAKPAAKPDKTESQPGIGIDYARMDKLNASFRQRRQRTLQDERIDKALHQAQLRSQQLHAWREQQVGGIGLKHLANMRRAELALRRSKELNRVSAKEKADAFAERRRKDLAHWRARRTDPHWAAYSN